MINSKGLRKFSLAVAATAFLVAGCSNQATDQATNQAPAPAKKAATGKPVAAKAAAAKPVASKPAAAKPAAKKPEAGKVVAVKGAAPAKPVTVSSKVTQPAASAATLVTVPKGTTISAKIDQALASNKNHAGDTFAAILSSSIRVDGKTVIPKGTHITGRVVTAQKKNPELTVALASVSLNGKSYKLVTDPISPSGKAPAKTDATEGDAAKAKDITVAAEHHLKFKLAKDVKLPVPAKG
jgi:PBP1b-binding outer membrane lipoprotein LpoB